MSSNLNSQTLGFEITFQLVVFFNLPLKMLMSLVIELPNDRIKTFDHFDKLAVTLVKFLK